jgi:hypothetical protein
MDSQPPRELKLRTVPERTVDHTLLTYYERRSKLVKAILWGLWIAVIGLAFDYLIRHLHLQWFIERVVENLFEGIFFGALVWIVLSIQERRIRQRFREVGYLNHHIRNSLTIIEMAEAHVAEANERLKLIQKASARIRRCVEKISRDEDVAISERFPEEP